METEQFKDLDQYPNYQIGNRGNIWSCLHKIFLKQTIQKQGYMQVCINKNYKKINVRINRLVALAFIPNPENKLYVNHIDGNKLNNSVDNLEWCSESENMIHAYKLGLEKPNKKLNKDQIIEIRQLSKLSITKDQIAKQFNVSRKTIFNVLKKLGGYVENI
jgi:hypothetical protein